MDQNDLQSNLLTFQLNEQPFSYTGKYSMRPDGSNSFEVIFLSEDNESPILSTIQIGCLM